MTNTTNPEIKEEAISLARIERQTLLVPIVGETPLIVHAWDQKMRDALPGGPNSGKKGRSKLEHPTAEEAFESSKYLLPDGTEGFPAVGFKSAMADAYHLFDGMKKVQLKQNLFVRGVGPKQLVPIIGESVMREDVVRIGMGTANLRHRAMYPEWGALLEVEFLPVKISPESVIALVDASGMGGVGEWRPSSPKSATGTFGRYRVDMDGLGFDMGAGA